jgi:soluble lytic murein transglycosylase-like protein
MHFEELRLNLGFENNERTWVMDADGQLIPSSADGSQSGVQSWYEAPGPAAWHEMMVAIATSMLTNKRVYVCFILALAMLLAASPMNRLAAAGNIPAVENSSQTVSQRALVVRADRRTGKLVRTVAPVKGSRDALAARPDPSFNIPEIVEKAAHDNHVDPLLVHSIIQVESNYNPYAVSPKGAQGLMQLMPPTARDLGVSNSFDPRQNIEAGVRYLKYLQDLYKDDRLALAAYNAGPAAVQKYKWIPPYPETQDYVNRVGEQYGAAKKAAAQHLAEPAVPPVGVMEETRPKLEPFVDAEGRLHLRNTPQ